MTLDIRQTLHSLFPHDADVLHALKLDSAHFRQLAERFDVVSKEIYRIETDIEPASEEHLDMMRKERLALLDEIGEMIAARDPGA